MSNTIKKNDYFKIKIFVGQHHGGTWTHTALLPSTFEEEGLVCLWPITQPLFLSGPRWDWIQMGHLITSLSLSLSALGWSFLRSALTLSMPATLYPLSPTETK